VHVSAAVTGNPISFSFQEASMAIPVARSEVIPVRRVGGRWLTLAVVAGCMLVAGCNWLESATPETPPQPAPDPPVDAQKAGVVTPAMLRVAAEALDGMRTGRLVHLVVSYDPDSVPRLYEDGDSARAAAAAGQGVYVAGVAPVDSRKRGLWQVVQVRVLLDSAGVRRVWTAPQGANLIAWDLSALDKFVLPYYHQVKGPEAARLLRARYTNSSARLMLYCHDVLSIDCAYEELDDGGW
jgi:hypothetical protein